MEIEIQVPKLGESISEVTVLEWHKKVGDEVAEDDVLVEIATDKVDAEIPAPKSGMITNILVSANQTVAVGTVLAIMEVSAGSISEMPQTSEPQKVVEKEKERPAKRKPKTFLSPLVLKIAQTEHLSIEEVEQIEGTGMGGRIRKSDVYKYLQTKSHPLPSRKASVVPQSAYAPPKIVAKPDDQLIELDRMRQIIAGHMVYSKTTAPHVTCYAEADMTHIVEHRQTIKARFLDIHSVKLTYTPIFIQVVAKALAHFPLINSALREQTVIVRNDINIGMATSLPNGNLIVPVVKNANQKSLVEVAKEVDDLSRKARTNALKTNDIEGGTFTISNVGTFGSLMGTPIINQPQSAILAIGTIQKKPAVLTQNGVDTIAVRHRMILSLSFDHRIINGQLAGDFVNVVKEGLETYVFPLLE